MGHGAKEAVWIKKFVRELELEVTETIILHDNNEMSIVFTKNAKSQRHTKYIDIQYYYIRKLIEEGEFIVFMDPRIPDAS